MKGLRAHMVEIVEFILYLRAFGEADFVFIQTEFVMT